VTGLVLADYLLHPLKGNGYQFYSGIGSSISEWITILVTVSLVMWRVRKRCECHVESPKNCHHWGHPVEGTGHRACRKHHPHAETPGSITEADIHRHHGEAKGQQ
jgi:hypothetical protein